MEHFLDITKDHCPMTFVKVKVKLANIDTGDRLDVLLHGDEPLKNVPKSAAEQGFIVLEIKPEGENHRVVIQKRKAP